MIGDLSSWSDAQKIRFLATLAHELTVCARGTYEAGTRRVLEPELLRSYNELQHRVTGSLRDYQRGKEGMPLSVVLEMLKNFGRKHDRQNDVEFAHRQMRIRCRICLSVVRFLLRQRTRRKGVPVDKL